MLLGPTPSGVTVYLLHDDVGTGDGSTEKGKMTQNFCGV